MVCSIKQGISQKRGELRKSGSQRISLRKMAEECQGIGEERKLCKKPVQTGQDNRRNQKRRLQEKP